MASLNRITCLRGDCDHHYNHIINIHWLICIVDDGDDDGEENGDGDDDENGDGDGEENGLHILL